MSEQRRRRAPWWAYVAGWLVGSSVTYVLTEDRELPDLAVAVIVLACTVGGTVIIGRLLGRWDRNRQGR